MSRLIVPSRYNEMPAQPAKAEFDPVVERDKIMRRLPDIAQCKIFGPRILVAKFIRDRLSASIAIAKDTATEDKWQGKHGLVLAIGHLAFQSDSVNNFGPDTVKVGDWVMFQYGDGQDYDYRPPGTHDLIPCKVLKDVEIAGLVPRPDMFF